MLRPDEGPPETSRSPAGRSSPTWGSASRDGVRPMSGHVAGYFGNRELQLLQHEAGTEDLQYAEGLLKAAGADFTSTVLVGRGAETIAQAARHYGCDRIVFGDEPPSLAGRMFGSLAQQVRHLLGGAAVQVIGS